jgi:hypothetical protein
LVPTQHQHTSIVISHSFLFFTFYLLTRSRKKYTHLERLPLNHLRTRTRPRRRR